MDPKLLIPRPDTIPVSWYWFKALLIPCFTIHLLFMNTLLGTAIIGWAKMVRPKAAGIDTCGMISRRLPFCMAFTINSGVAALLFMQVLYGHFFYTSSVLMAVWWLSIPALVITAYAAAYWLDFRFDTLAAGGRWAIWSIMVLGLLLVGFVFVGNMTLMLDPPAWVHYFKQPGGTLWHFDDATLLPRYLHFVIASVAVGGLALALWNRKGGDDPVHDGLQWFTTATGLQFIVGGWFFLVLPQPIRLALMGGDTWASVILALSLLGVLLALVFGIKKMLWPAVGATAATVAGMVFVRDAVRSLYLAPYFSLEDLAVAPQYSPMVVFAVFVALGVAAIWYILKLWKGAAEG